MSTVILNSNIDHHHPMESTSFKCTKNEELSENSSCMMPVHRTLSLPLSTLYSKLEDSGYKGLRSKIAKSLSISSLLCKFDEIEQIISDSVIEQDMEDDSTTGHSRTNKEPKNVFAFQEDETWIEFCDDLPLSEN